MYDDADSASNTTESTNDTVHDAAIAGTDAATDADSAATTTDAAFRDRFDAMVRSRRANREFLPDALPEDYRRFLVNGLRRDFDMPGTPIRLLVRGGENPYAGRRKPNVTSLDKHKPRRVTE